MYFSDGEGGLNREHDRREARDRALHVFGASAVVEDAAEADDVDGAGRLNARGLSDAHGETLTVAHEKVSIGERSLAVRIASP